MNDIARKKTNTITILIAIGVAIILFILGGIFGTIDYNRVKNNMTPKFCIILLDRPRNNQTCWGLGYKVQREFIVPSNQPFRHAQRFGLWIDQKQLYRQIDYNDYGSNYLFTVKEERKCPKTPTLYYVDKNNKKYYLYCLHDVLVNLDNESLSLKEALKENKITIEKVIEYLTQTEVWYDGGTKIFKDTTNEYSKYGFSILKCNNSGINNDVYIGPSFMHYEKGFCN